MPIEIKELHIKINVDNEQSKPEASKGARKEQIVEECVAKVMEIIRHKNER